MSKTRTGRKGRARLAVAAHLETIQAGGPEDATAADAFGPDALLQKLGAMAKGQGTNGELFFQGQLIAPLADSVDTEDRVNSVGIFSSDSGDGTTALAAGINGEQSLAADADFAELRSGFRHYYMTAAGVTSTSSKGIAYLPSGPGADFVPENHGLGVGGVVSLDVNVSADELIAAGSPDNLAMSIIGNATAGVADVISGSISAHTPASAAVTIADVSLMTAAAGSALKITDNNNDLILEIVFAADGTNGLDAAGPVLSVVDSATRVFVIDGDTAGMTVNAMATNIKAGVDAWNAVHGTAVTATVAAPIVTFLMNKHQAENGRAAGGASFGDALTVTGYKTFAGSSIPLQPALASDQWLNNGVSDVAFVPFSGGSTEAGPPFAITVSDGDTSNADIGLRLFGDKHVSYSINLSYTVGTDDTTARNGIAAVWCLTSALV